MKHFSLILLALLLAFTSLKAQKPVNNINNRMVEAVLRGKADYFKPLLDTGSKYQRDATYILNSPLQIVFHLKHFFELYPCSSAHVVSHGGLDKFSYAKIDYRASNSQQFSVFLFFNEDKISKIRIDRE